MSPFGYEVLLHIKGAAGVFIAMYTRLMVFIYLSA